MQCFDVHMHGYCCLALALDACFPSVHCVSYTLNQPALMQILVDHHNLQHNLQLGALCTAALLPGRPRHPAAIQSPAQVCAGQAGYLPDLLAGMAAPISHAGSCHVCTWVIKAEHAVSNPGIDGSCGEGSQMQT